MVSGFASGLEIRVRSNSENESLPEIVHQQGSETPPEVLLEIVGPTPDGIPIMQWQTGLMLMALPGASGSLLVGSLSKPDDALFDFPPAPYGELPAAAITISSVDIDDPPGKVIVSGETPPIATLSIDVSEDAAGQFLLSMPPYDEEALDTTSFWGTPEFGGAFFPFMNAINSDGTIHLAIIEIATVASSNGDFNDDLSVDAADYTVWRDGLGGIYGAEHYDIWKTTYGTSATSAIGSAVPEPSTTSQLVACVAACFFAFERVFGKRNGVS
jgi:hypothetical protein